MTINPEILEEILMSMDKYRFDHVAVAVWDMGTMKRHYEILGYRCGETIHDPLQNVYLAMCQTERYNAIELISPVDHESPVYRLLRQNGNTPYHLCYRVPNWMDFLAQLDHAGIVYQIVRETQPAVLFNSLKVTFILVDEVGLFEFIEDPCSDSDLHQSPPENLSLTRILVANLEKALRFYQFLGYTMDRKQNAGETSGTILTRPGTGEIELIVPPINTPESQILVHVGPGPCQMGFAHPELAALKQHLLQNGYEYHSSQEPANGPEILQVAGFPYHLHYSGAGWFQQPFPTLLPFKPQQFYSLTHSQQRIWFSEINNWGGMAQNIMNTVIIEGPIDLEILSKAIHRVIMNNEGLRLRITEINGEIQQYVAPYQQIQLDCHDFSGADGAAKLEQWLAYQRSTPLELMDGNLFYFGLARFNCQESGFFFKIHHLITDGWSNSLIINQILQYVNDLQRGIPISEEAKPSFTGYIASEAAYLQSKVFQKHRKFWSEKFKTIPGSAGLKYYALDNSDRKADRAVFPIPDDLAAQIYQFSETRDISIFIVLLALVYKYLAMITAEDDIVIGTMTHNRYNTTENDMVGIFINAAAIRLKISQGLDFQSLVKALSGELMAVFMHQKYPFDLLMKDIRENNPGVELPSLFDTLISYQKVWYDPKIKREYHYHGIEEEPLRIHMEDIEGRRLELMLHYRISIFTPGEIQSLAGQLCNLLRAALCHPDQKLSWFDLLTPEEQRQWSPKDTRETNTQREASHSEELGAGESAELFSGRVQQTFINIPTAFQDKPLGLPEVREYWASQMPGFILPAYYIRLHKVPLALLAEQKQRETAAGETPATILAVAATFTADPMADYIQWWGKQFGESLAVRFAPYNQVFQELLEPAGLLSKNSGVNLLLIRFEDWLRNDQDPEPAQIEKLERNLAELTVVLQNKPKTIPYLVGIFPVATHLPMSGRVLQHLETMYTRWQEILTGMENVYPVDFRELAALYQIAEIFDPVKDREGHLPFTDEFYAALGTMVARKICAWKKQWFKVIVLDCDNTLWKGVCGEDGPLGVEISGPYCELQRFLIEKSAEGMLLALCSKNNEADVWEVFSRNPGMVLKPEHLAGWRINWQAKSGNLKELARELNLGLDSFIFLDDSAMECTEVMTRCPEVLTLQLPPDPGQIPLFLNHIWAFDRFKVTEEDRQRREMYLAERKRQGVQKEGLSLAGFLSGLELKMSMKLMEKSQIPRVSQLTQRTNQFNLSTIRRTEEEIENLIQVPNTACWTVEASDRFGDYGLVGVLITQAVEAKLCIDTFLLSCRVLGRTIENAVLTMLKRHCRERNLEVLEAKYYPTDKNRPFFEFIGKTGWRKTLDGDGYAAYILPVEDIPDSMEFVDCYYQTSYPKAEAKKSQPEAKPECAQPKLDSTVLPANTPRAHIHWQVEAANEENLTHRNQLLPIRNYTGELLLSLPVAEQKQPVAVQTQYAAPRNETETQLVHIWQTILGIPRIGIHDRFFELGGDSLKAVQIVSRARQANIQITIMDIYRHRNIADIAENINPGEIKRDALITPGNVPNPASNEVAVAANPVVPASGVPERKDLPIKLQTDITVYLCHSLALCAILTDERLLPWFYEHYIQLFSMAAENGHVMLEFLEVRSPYKDMMYEVYLGYNLLADVDNIIDFVIQKINLDYYVIINVDEYYLPNKRSYQINHFVHHSIVYGYDNQRRELKAIGFNAQGIFTELAFDYDLFAEAYENGKIHYRQWAPWAETNAVELLKFRDFKREYPFNMQRFIAKLGDYLNSTPDDSVIYSLRLDKELLTGEKVAYGFQVYEVVIGNLLKLLDNQVFIDYRALHLLFEHKLGLEKRLKFTQSRYTMAEETAELIQAYSKIVEQFQAIRLKFFEITLARGRGRPTLSLPDDEPVIRELIRMITAAKNEEFELLTRIYQKLRAQFQI
jgi:FkbH-like protein